MKVEEIAIRQEIRQMLSESGINKNTLKEMVKGVLHEDVEKACKQAFAEKDMDGIVARKLEYGFDKIVKEVIRESVRDRINAIFHRMTIDIDVTDRNGTSYTETRKTGDL